MLARLLAAAWLVLFAAASFAQIDAPMDAPPALSPADLQRAMDEVEAAPELTDEVRKALLQTYHDAQKELDQAQELQTQLAAYQQARRTAEDDLRKLAEETGKPAVKLAVPAEATTEQLRQGQSAAAEQATAAEAQLRRLEAEVARRSQRAAAIPVERTRVAEQIGVIDRELAAAQATPLSTDPQWLSAQTLRLAQRQRLAASAALLDYEPVVYEATRDLLRKRLELATRQKNESAEAAAAWDKALAERTQMDADQQFRDARLAVVTTRKELLPDAEKNNEFAKSRQGAESPGSQAEAAEQLAAQLKAQRDQLADEFGYVKSVAELTGSQGRLLQDMRNRLPNPREMRRQIYARQRKIDEARLKRIELDGQLKQLADIPRRAQTLVTLMKPAPTEADVPLILRELQALLAKRKELLTALTDDYDRYIAAAEQGVNVNQSALAAETEQYRTYLDENIFWVPTMPPLGAAGFAEGWRSIAQTVAPDAWEQAVASVANDLSARPLGYLLAAIACVAWTVTAPRLRRRSREIGEDLMRNYTASIEPTLRVLIITLWLALFWPMLLAWLGARLLGLSEPTALLTSLGTGLRFMATVLATVNLVRHVCRRKGLGEAHFLWIDSSLVAIRHRLRWLVIFAPPVAFLIGAAHGSDDPALDASLGRALFVASMLLMSLMSRGMLRPTYEIIRDRRVDVTPTWLDGLRYLWYPVATLAPLAPAVMAAAGYYDAAIEVATHLIANVWLLFGLVVARSILLRVVLIERRKLAIQRARLRRAEIQAESDAADNPPMPAAEVDLGLVDAQVRRLVASGFLAALAIGSWLIWIDVLPALQFAADWALWSYGSPAQQVTVGSLIMAALIGLLTLIASRNIPGLLEIAWLSHLPLDAGARYAVTTVVRYIIVIVGMVIAFQQIGITWSSVQWLAAAVTVGLGFGLQEIFANFVSGLIILFERPMRIGDIVTVSGVTGRVARVRARATTIVDWDRKELIVPNKEFITGQLINWTLTDTVLRVIVPVGIAYGSDVSRALKLLLEVARGIPLVLDDPPPQAVFKEFGNSTLNMELRAFIRSPDDMIAARHELHLGINAAFRNAGIEISFPQLDVHVRSIEAALPISRAAARFNS